jgi:lysyl-tRNA synthetase class 2
LPILKSTKEEVILAGRLMGKRIMGKASFAELKDAEGRIQIYVSRDDISTDEKTMYNVVSKNYWILAILLGFVERFSKRRWVKSVHVYGLTVLAKLPLPVVKTDADGKRTDAFADAEQRYRRRYVDLTVNDHVKETFIKRTKMFNAMRSFNDRGYLGGNTCFTTDSWWCCSTTIYHAPQPLDMPLYMRIANELYLKD